MPQNLLLARERLRAAPITALPEAMVLALSASYVFVKDMRGEDVDVLGSLPAVAPAA